MSIYNPRGWSPPNPLDTMSQAVGIANALQQNRLLKTELERERFALARQQVQALTQAVSVGCTEPTGHRREAVLAALEEGAASGLWTAKAQTAFVAGGVPPEGPELNNWLAFRVSVFSSQMGRACLDANGPN
jgi:hypothetical protein